MENSKFNLGVVTVTNTCQWATVRWSPNITLHWPGIQTSIWWAEAQIQRWQRAGCAYEGKGENMWRDQHQDEGTRGGTKRTSRLRAKTARQSSLTQLQNRFVSPRVGGSIFLYSLGISSAHNHSIKLCSLYDFLSVSALVALQEDNGRTVQMRADSPNSAEDEALPANKWVSCGDTKVRITGIGIGIGIFNDNIDENQTTTNHHCEF